MNLIPFNFNGADIRVITDDDSAIWFVAKDVAEDLGYVWAGTITIAHVPDQWRGVRSVLTPSGTQQMAVLTEQGLYFFLGRSDKAGALPMQMWVAGDVLPTIRATGSYQRPMTQAEITAANANQLVEVERQQREHQVALDRMETRVSIVEQVRYLDSRPAGFESMTCIRERINRRHGMPPWLINAVMRDIPGAVLPFAMVRSKHADEGAQPYAIWPTADITRRFDRFVAECTFVTAERATHPDIQQGRFKLRPRKSV